MLKYYLKYHLVMIIAGILLLPLTVTFLRDVVRSRSEPRTKAFVSLAFDDRLPLDQRDPHHPWKLYSRRMTGPNLDAALRDDKLFVYAVSFTVLFLAFFCGDRIIHGPKKRPEPMANPIRAFNVVPPNKLEGTPMQVKPVDVSRFYKP